MGKLRPGKQERIAIRQKKALAKPSRVSENPEPTRQVWIGSRAVCRYDVPSLISCADTDRLRNPVRAPSMGRAKHNRLNPDNRLRKRA